jgi:hypothetical protein
VEHELRIRLKLSKDLRWDKPEAKAGDAASRGAVHTGSTQQRVAVPAAVEPAPTGL